MYFNLFLGYLLFLIEITLNLWSISDHDGYEFGFKISNFAHDVEIEVPRCVTHIQLHSEGFKKMSRLAEWTARHPSNPVRNYLFYNDIIWPALT
jgi:hypothetical protein